MGIFKVSILLILTRVKLAITSSYVVGRLWSHLVHEQTLIRPGKASSDQRDAEVE